MLADSFFIHLSFDFHHLLYFTPINRPNFCVSECQTLLVAVSNDFHVLLLTKFIAQKYKNTLKITFVAKRFLRESNPQLVLRRANRWCQFRTRTIIISPLKSRLFSTSESNQVNSCPPHICLR